VIGQLLPVEAVASERRQPLEHIGPRLAVEAELYTLVCVKLGVEFARVGHAGRFGRPLDRLGRLLLGLALLGWLGLPLGWLRVALGSAVGGLRSLSAGNRHGTPRRAAALTHDPLLGDNHRP